MLRISIGLNLINNNVTLNNPEYILVWKDTNFVIPSEIIFNITNEELLKLYRMMRLEELNEEAKAVLLTIY